MADDKNWASRDLLDPLNAPQPGEETGPGSSFIMSTSSALPRRSVSTSHRPRRFSGNQGNSPTSHNYPTPPTSASPRAERLPPFPADGGHSSGQPVRSSGRPRRHSSLSARFPGDQSHRPLSIIRHDVKLANRAPHLRKTHIPGTDTIDSLDSTGALAYHHEGPYDATLLSRNLTSQTSPVAAVHSTNAEALRATPNDLVRQTLEKHRPLDGVSVIPPGKRDFSGQKMVYEEGTDLMIENGGNYKRWPGVEYLPQDLNGKGEPAFSIERALNHHRHNDDEDDDTVPYGSGSRHRAVSASHAKHAAGPQWSTARDERTVAFEMQPPARRASSSDRAPRMEDDARRESNLKSYSEWERENRGHKREGSGGSMSGIGAGIKRGLGSLRRRKQHA